MKKSKIALLWADPTFRKKHREGVLRAVSKPEWRENHRKATSSLEFRRRRSTQMVSAWKDKSYRSRIMQAKSSSNARDKVSAANKKMWLDPEHRQKVSNSIRNLWRISEFRQKVMSSLQNAHRTLWDGFSASERSVHIKKLKLGARHSPNKPESQLKQILDQSFPNEFKLNVEGETVIGGKIPDFVNVNGKKVVVELFGDYWHGKQFTGLDEAVHEIRRKATFANWGFKTIVIWEHELKDPVAVVEKIARATGLGGL